MKLLESENLFKKQIFDVINDYIQYKYLKYIIFR